MVKEEVGKKEKRIKSLRKEIDQWNHGIDKFQAQIDEQEEEHKKKNNEQMTLEKNIRKAEKIKHEEIKKQNEIQNEKDILKKKKEEQETILALEKDALSAKQRIGIFL